MKFTREELEKMPIKPWELGYEMMKQQGHISSYRTISFSDEDENGYRQLQMAFVPIITVKSIMVDVGFKV